MRSDQGYFISISISSGQGRFKNIINSIHYLGIIGQEISDSHSLYFWISQQKTKYPPSTDILKIHQFWQIYRCQTNITTFFSALKVPIGWKSKVVNDSAIRLGSPDLFFGVYLDRSLFVADASECPDRLPRPWLGCG